METTAVQTSFDDYLDRQPLIVVNGNVSYDVRADPNNIVGKLGGSLVLLLAACGTLGNLLVLVAVTRCRTLQRSYNAYIGSLSATDLVFILTVMPFYADTYFRRKWIYSAALCKWHTYFGTAVIIASAFHIAVIAVSRYHVIVRPRFYARWMASSRAVALQIAATWLIAAAIVLPGVFGLLPVSIGYSDQLSRCNYIRAASKEALSLVFVGGFIIPCAVLIFCYLMIWFRTYQSQRRMNIYSLTCTTSDSRQQWHANGPPLTTAKTVLITAPPTGRNSASSVLSPPAATPAVHVGEDADRRAVKSTVRLLLKSQNGDSLSPKELARCDGANVKSVFVESPDGAIVESGQISVIADGVAATNGCLIGKGSPQNDCSLTMMSHSDAQLLAVVVHVPPIRWWQAPPSGANSPPEILEPDTQTAEGDVSVNLTAPTSVECSPTGDRVPLETLRTSETVLPELSSSANGKITTGNSGDQHLQATASNPTGLNVVNCRRLSSDLHEIEVRMHRLSPVSTAVTKSRLSSSDLAASATKVSSSRSNSTQHGCTGHGRSHSLHMIMAVFLAYVVTYLPFSLTNLLDDRSQFSRNVYMMTSVAFWSGSCINPLIYGIMNRQFRRAYRSILVACVHRPLSHINLAR